jgi:hypothetical protein
MKKFLRGPQIGIVCLQIRIAVQLRVLEFVNRN